MNTTQNQRGNYGINSELKPCPKCNGAIRIIIRNDKGAFAICERCKSVYQICGMDKIPVYDGVKIRKSTVKKIKNMWNRKV